MPLNYEIRRDNCTAKRQRFAARPPHGVPFVRDIGLKPVLDLGVTALVDTLVTREKLNAPRKQVSAASRLLPECALMQVCDTRSA